MGNNSNQYTTDCPDWIKPYLDQAAQKYGVPTLLLSAQISHESGFQPSSRGYNQDKSGQVLSTDRGIAQIIEYWHPEISTQQADDPAFAVDWMARTMGEKVKRLGDYGKALSEYNTGNPNDGFANGYVNRIMSRAGLQSEQPIADNVAPNPARSQGFGGNYNEQLQANNGQPQPQNYTVQSGDTLWDLARRFTGNGANYGQFGYQGDPHKLRVGTQLPILGQNRSLAQNQPQNSQTPLSTSTIGGKPQA